MRIGCLQFAPQVGDLDNNLNRADSVLSKANPEGLDLLVLPELAFTGYNFKSLRDISPFLEPSGSGITSLWARTIALKYNCVVTVGYPEKVDVTPKWPTGPEYYNSTIVFNEEGETIASYRKSFLYYTDETWALEGNQGFYANEISGLGNVSMGICMDLNPYKFEAPWDAFEFAYHVLEENSNIVILTMAWMTREDPRHFSRMPNEPDMETLTYWVTRLEPLIRDENEDEIIVVFCNRTGHEGEATYAGTSAVIGIQDGEVKVYGILGRGEKALLVVDTDDVPFAKLVYRPSADGRKTGTFEKLQPSHDDNEQSPSIKSPGSTLSGDEQLIKLPPLPPSPESDETNVSPRKHVPAAIVVPKGLGINDQTLSPGSNNFRILTPSAPTPTPMTLRPLIIPQSPPILPHQYPPDHPISAASLASERSMRSVLSNGSEASVNTVRSNPRPPEDSTPYPHSGQPLSGYPMNFSSHKSLYGGQVAIQQDEPYDTGTPFDDMSPLGSRWAWGSVNTTFPTPSTAGLRSAGTPIGRYPEPFPWPVLLPTKHSPIAEEPPAPVDNDSTWKDSARTKTPSPKLPASSGQAQRVVESTDKPSSKPQEESLMIFGIENQPLRPASPKSRNTSRTRMPERSASAVSNNDISKGLSQRLQDLSQQITSEATKRASSVERYSNPDKHQPVKSRARSQGRSNETQSKQANHTIRVAACPSILGSLSNVGGQQRSNSVSKIDVSVQRGTDGRSHTPKHVGQISRPASRAASRGRTPGPKSNPISDEFDLAALAADRSSSADSTRNGKLHSRIHPTDRSRTRGNSSTRKTQHRRHQPTALDRFEAVIGVSFPTRGRNSSSSMSRTDASISPMAQSTPSPNVSTPSTSPGISIISDQTERRGRTRAVETSEPQSLDYLLGQKQNRPFIERIDTSGHYFSDIYTQNPSTSGKSSATSPFERKTPTAMTMASVTADLEALLQIS